MRTDSFVSMEHAVGYFAADMEPVLAVDEGDSFTLEARSILSGGVTQLPTSYDDLVIPVTGPVEVRGVRAGDVLRIDVHDISIADRGAMVTLPGFGAFAEPLKLSGKVLEISDGLVHFAEGLDLPVNPMIGKIGVGVRDNPPRSNTVGSHGGNMDCKNIVANSAVLLPVQVDGARLFAGDLHARQGDGESSMTAVEVEGRITLSCRAVSGPVLRRPVVLSGDDVIVIADGTDLDEAVKRALADITDLLMSAHQWPREEAAMFISVAGDVGVCELVNPRVAAKVSMPRAYFNGTFG